MHRTLRCYRFDLAQAKGESPLFVSLAKLNI
jgi:hypothetical protein